MRTDFPEVSNSDDIIDSRDVIAELEHLRETFEDLQVDENGFDDAANDYSEELAKLAILEALNAEGEGFSDWEYGATMVRDSYFQNYAESLAEETGMYDINVQEWPLNCIDWEKAAEELQTDYSCISFDGVEYWIR